MTPIEPQQNQRQGEKSRGRFFTSVHFVTLVMAVAAVLVSPLDVHARFTCEDLFRSERLEVATMNGEPPAPSSRVEVKAFSLEHAPEDVVNGHVRFRPQSVSSDGDLAMLDILEMFSAARFRYFPVNRYKASGDGFSRLYLGFHIGKGYSVEVEYHGTNRSEDQDQFTVYRAQLVDPMGIPVDGKASPRLGIKTNERGDIEITGEIALGMFTEIADFDFTIGVPPRLQGTIVDRIDHFVENHLAFLQSEKSVVHKASRMDSFRMASLYLRSQANINRLKEYWRRGLLFKAPVRYLISGIATVAVSVAGYAYFAQGTPYSIPNLVSTIFDKSDQELLEKAFSEVADSEGLPPEIRKEFEALRRDVNVANVSEDSSGTNSEKSIDRSTETKYLPKRRIDLANPNKLQINKSQFVWITREFDPIQKKDVTLLVVTRDNGRAIRWVAMQLDPKKYKKLIQYTERRGEFVTYSAISKDVDLDSGEKK